MQSAITSIEEYSTQTEDERTLLRHYGLEEEFVKIGGYAYSGGGRAIQRVDVSVDGGVTWKQATLEPNASKGSKTWSWAKWTHMVPKGYVGKEIVVKAVDEAYNTQVSVDEARCEWEIASLRARSGERWLRGEKPGLTGVLIMPDSPTPPLPLSLSLYLSPSLLPQPESYEATWNARGNLTTSWHRVPRPTFKS